MRATWLASLTSLVACLSVDFAPAGGGGGEANGGAGGQGAGPVAGAGEQGGAGATGGEGGCQPTCSEDRRCGDNGCGGLCSDRSIPDGWGLATPTQTRAILPWAETQSVFVASDKTQVRRVDTCTGLELATLALPSADGEREIRELSRFGDVLFVLYNEPGGVLAEKRLLQVSARTMEPLGLPISLGGANEDRPFFSGDSGPAYAWMNLAASGFVARVDAGGGSCSQAIDFNAERPGGVVALGPEQAIVAWRVGSAGTLYQLGPSKAQCASVLLEGPPFDHALVPHGLAHNSTHVFVAGFADIDVDVECLPNLESGLLRASLDSLAQEARTTLAPMGCINAFVDVVADDEAVFAVGTREAEQLGVGGVAWLARYDPLFDEADPAVAETFLEGGLIAWQAAMDPLGLYISGLAEGDRGFLVKCTRELQCGSIPN